MCGQSRNIRVWNVLYVCNKYTICAILNGAVLFDTHMVHITVLYMFLSHHCFNKYINFVLVLIKIVNIC